MKRNETAKIAKTDKTNKASKTKLADLKNQEKELYTEKFKLRLEVRSGTLKKTASFKLKKRELARVKTQIRKIELAGEEAK